MRFWNTAVLVLETGDTAASDREKADTAAWGTGGAAAQKRGCAAVLDDCISGAGNWNLDRRSPPDWGHRGDEASLSREDGTDKTGHGDRTDYNCTLETGGVDWAVVWKPGAGDKWMVTGHMEEPDRPLTGQKREQPPLKTC
ncbi:uncharacterized protein V6R79_010824 [Siganus canaliculatus]